MKINPCEKGDFSLSPPRLACIAWGFRARSRLARSTIPEEKWGLLVLFRLYYINEGSARKWGWEGSLSFLLVVSFVEMPCYFPSADPRPRRNHKTVRYRSKVRGKFLETPHSAFCTQPVPYSESAVCILHSVFILPLVRSLRFILTG